MNLGWTNYNLSLVFDEIKLEGNSQKEQNYLKFRR